MPKSDSSGDEFLSEDEDEGSLDEVELVEQMLDVATETYLRLQATADSIIRFAMLHQPKIFEHPEAFEYNDISNPPVRPFYPAAPEDEQKLTPAQLAGVRWMESRVEKGGGFIGDECGMGKVLVLRKMT